MREWVTELGRGGGLETGAGERRGGEDAAGVEEASVKLRPRGE